MKKRIQTTENRDILLKVSRFSFLQKTSPTFRNNTMEKTFYEAENSTDSEKRENRKIFELQKI